MTTAPAGVTPPSDVGGNSWTSGGVTIDMLLVMRPVVSRVPIDGKSSEHPASHLVVIFSPSESTSLMWSSEAEEIESMPFFKTYTPPPTAPARQATCAISASPPHLGKTAPKPGPKTPMLRRWRAINGNAEPVHVLFAALGSRVKDSRAPCDDGGRPNFCWRKSGKGLSASLSQASGCSS